MSENGFRRTTLNDVCVLVTDGTHDSPKLQPDGVPFIKGKHISKGVIDFENCDYITYEDHLKVIARSKPERGDTLFSNIGSVGDAAYVHSDIEFSIKNVALLKPNPQIIDSRYLYYLVTSPSFQADIVGSRSGSAQPFIGLDRLRRFEITIHDSIDVQRRIASILSAYDDLIENNTRRIAILEEMAQSLYREWFVHFRYPGHEHVPLVDSPLGPVPEGWTVAPIGEVVDTLGGGTPSTKEPSYWEDGEVIWYSPTDLTSAGAMFISDSAKHITDMGLQKSAARMFPAYSVMMTSRATIGAVAINTQPACTNQGFITCVPNDRLSAYEIYYWLQTIREEIISVASGATFKEINRGTFRKLPVILADERIRRQFTTVINPLARQIETLGTKNRNLRRTRDLLLPKLISGDP